MTYNLVQIHLLVLIHPLCLIPLLVLNHLLVLFCRLEFTLQFLFKLLALFHVLCLIQFMFLILPAVSRPALQSHVSNGGIRFALRKRPMQPQSSAHKYTPLVFVSRKQQTAKKKKKEKKKRPALKSHHPHCFLNITLSAAASAADTGYSLARYLLNNAAAFPCRNYFSCSRRCKQLPPDFHKMCPHLAHQPLPHLILPDICFMVNVIARCCTCAFFLYFFIYLFILAGWVILLSQRIFQ